MIIADSDRTAHLTEAAHALNAKNTSLENLVRELGATAAYHEHAVTSIRVQLEALHTREAHGKTWICGHCTSLATYAIAYPCRSLLAAGMDGYGQWPLLLPIPEHPDLTAARAHSDALRALYAEFRSRLTVILDTARFGDWKADVHDLLSDTELQVHLTGPAPKEK